MDGTVLIADDDRTIRTVLTQTFTRAGCKVHATASMVTLMRWVAEGRGDLVISDVVMPDGNGLRSLPEIKKVRPQLPVIIISAQNTIVTAIRAEESSAFDYLPKPFDLAKLMQHSAKALDQKRQQAVRETQRNGEFDIAHNPKHTHLPLLGQSEVMQTIYRLIARTMNSDLPILISGESGTGKSLIAKTIHDFSQRQNMPFIVLQSTDIVRKDSARKTFQKAIGGSLVLDNLADYSLEAQSTLIRLIDEFNTQKKPRFIGISQESLANKLSEGTFRKDLFFRLGGIAVEIPPLRERVEDITLLAHHFLQHANHQSKNTKSLSCEAYELLLKAEWPGNVRQLETLIKRLVLITTNDTISVAEITGTLDDDAQMHTDHITYNKTYGKKKITQGENSSISDSMRQKLEHYFALHNGELPPAGLYQRVLKEVEVPLIEIALDATEGNQAKCATFLGINRNTLRKKISELDIHVARRKKMM